MDIIKRLFFPLLAIIITMFIISHGNFTYEDLATELMGAIMFTFMFFLVQNAFGPSIKISREIATLKRGGEKRMYMFKLKNNSFSSVRDVKISARIKTSYYADIERIIEFVTMELPLETDYIESINGIWSAYRNRNGNNVYLIKLPRGLRKHLSENYKSMEIQVTCSDSVIGKERTFTQKYHGTYCLKEGKFSFGQSLDIK